MGFRGEKEGEVGGLTSVAVVSSVVRSQTLTDEEGGPLATLLLSQSMASVASQQRPGEVIDLLDSASEHSGASDHLESDHDETQSVGGEAAMDDVGGQGGDSGTDLGEEGGDGEQRQRPEQVGGEVEVDERGAGTAQVGHDPRPEESVHHRVETETHEKSQPIDEEVDAPESVQPGLAAGEAAEAQELQQLREECQRLRAENAHLKSENSTLRVENADMKKR